MVVEDLALQAGAAVLAAAAAEQTSEALRQMLHTGITVEMLQAALVVAAAAKDRLASMDLAGEMAVPLLQVLFLERL